jgi:hypothetical protein
VVASLAGHDEDSSTEAVAFSRHQPNVAMSAGMDGKLILWDLAAAGQRAICGHPEVGLGMVLDAGVVLSKCPCCTRRRFAMSQH